MTGIDLEYTSTIETGLSCRRTTTECCKKTWTKRRTSPGLQRPDKQREHLAEACRAAAAQPVSVSLAWEAGRRKVGFEKPSEEASTVAASELRGISLVHALTRLSSDHPT